MLTGNKTVYESESSMKFNKILKRGIELIDDYQKKELEQGERINNIYDMFGIQKQIKPETYLEDRLLKNVSKEDLFLYLVDIILKESLSKEQYDKYLEQKHLIFNKQFTNDIFLALKQHVGDSFKNIPIENNNKKQQQTMKVGIKK